MNWPALTFATADPLAAIKALLGGIVTAGAAWSAGVSDSVTVALIGVAGTVVVALIGAIPAMRRIDVERTEQVLDAQLGMVKALQEEITRLHEERIAINKALMDHQQMLSDCYRQREHLSSQLFGRRSTDHPGDGT